MKKFLTLCLAVLMLATPLLTSCSGKDTPAETKKPAPTSVELIKDSASEYTIVRPLRAQKDSVLFTAGQNLQSAIATVTGVTMEYKTDTSTAFADQDARDAAKEILIGRTNRKQSAAAVKTLAFNEYVIKVDGNKIIICGVNDKATLQAAEYFAANYITNGNLIELPATLEVKGVVDMSVSEITNTTYEEMGDVILKAYADKYLNRDGSLIGTEYWDTAEILEAFIDAYEQTKKPEYLKYAEDIALRHFGSNNTRTDWCRNNAFNDDIAWMCIGFARLYLLTGNRNYISLAKSNFDTMWKRAYSPTVLDGGLWWKDDQKNTKNSCIQCPASIAACLIAKGTGDDSYYEKAKELMEWEFKHLFEPNTGKVYDAYSTDGNKSTWSSTYNQGTFVGACTLLHEKYGDEKYLKYADKAVKFGMTRLDNKDGVLTGEASGNDLPGFKGILTRWFYRYAQYTQDMDVLVWLQKNADVAYSNRNRENIVWSTWAEKSKDQFYDPWGASAAMALLFNCEPWW